MQKAVAIPQAPTTSERLTPLQTETSGLLVPLGELSLNTDPAHTGTMEVTTITDVTGFFLWFGIGTLTLLMPKEACSTN